MRARCADFLKSPAGAGFKPLIDGAAEACGATGAAPTPPSGPASPPHGRPAISGSDCPCLNGADCHWTVTCEAGNVVTVVFEQLETEEDDDWRVEIYDGVDTDAGSLSGRLSGDTETLAEHQFVSSSESMTVDFKSGESAGADGAGRGSNHKCM